MGSISVRGFISDIVRARAPDSNFFDSLCPTIRDKTKRDKRLRAVTILDSTAYTLVVANCAGKGYSEVIAIWFGCTSRRGLYPSISTYRFGTNDDSEESYH